MSLYINISDFKGRTKIASDKFTKLDLQDYLDEFEVIYLQDLLGCDLYTDFAIDFAIDGTKPTDPKFTEIWEPFCIDDGISGCDIQRSDGINKMLTFFLFFEFTRDQPVKNNIGGNRVNEQSNSREAVSNETNILTNYNKGLESYWAIQRIICDNPNNFDWDKYNGQVKRLIGSV